MSGGPVSAGILGRDFPFPLEAGPDDRVEVVELRLPAEYMSDFVGGGDQDGRVAGAAGVGIERWIYRRGIRRSLR